ncbi:MAG TPA: shikimate dehydrogenase [Spirochaetia bacterium]|nr:shikimate dehydrogenase [Spirochaetia bacterium]
MYFVGVTTTRSMIMKVFPAWAKRLELGDCQLKGIDLKLHDEPQRYREVVQFIKDDPLSLGALVTTHKIDLIHATRDMFDGLDDFASLMGEVSSISKSDGRLMGGAKDPISSGLALESFLPAQHWESTRADAFILGAGGSSVALCSYLVRPEHDANRPARVFVSNRSPKRLEDMKEIHRKQRVDVPVSYVHTPRPEDNDEVLRGLPPGSLVANATGLGKDAPGSPLTGAASFPRSGFAWDFNYRGNLVFLDQARAQGGAKGLVVEDGWLYFIYGWLAVIAEVFHRPIPLHGPMFDELCHLAEKEKARD